MSIDNDGIVQGGQGRSGQGLRKEIPVWLVTLLAAIGLVASLMWLNH